MHLLFCLSLPLLGQETYRIEKVSLHGIFTGKDYYKQLYRLHKGNFFAQAEHTAGIEAITKDLHKKGYYNAVVTTGFTYHEKYKTVTVALTLACGAPYKINDIVLTFDGCDADATQQMHKKLSQKLQRRLLGAVCDQQLLDGQARMLSAYLAKKGYLSAPIELHTVCDHATCTMAVTFVCTLKDKRHLLFVGNRAFSTQKLYDVCAAFGKTLFIIPPELLVQELRDFYTQQGFLDVAITVQNDEQSLIFIIDEGRKPAIVDVDIQGLPPDSMHRLSHFAAAVKGEYDYKKLQNTLTDFVSMIISDGYPNARVVDVVYHKRDDGTYTLQVILDVGEREFVASVQGDEFPEMFELLYKQEWARTYHQFTSPVALDKTLIMRMRKFLQKQLYQQGYLYTHVVPDITGPPEGRTVTWQFLGNKKQITYGDTQVQGACHVPEQLIKQACRYQQGDRWDKKKLDDTAYILRSFDIFDQVSVYPQALTTDEDAKKIIIQVQESDPFELRARAGFQGVGTNFSWRGGATYTAGGTFLWKNPLKAADLLSIKADVTFFLRYVMLMYQRAFVGHLPISQQYKVYSNRYDQPVVLGSREILYKYAQDGFLVCFSQDRRGMQWGVTAGIDWMKISDISPTLAHAIDFTTQFIDKHIPYFFIEPSFYVSDIDNRLDPQCGWYLLLSSKGLAPSSVRDGAFLKFLLEQGNYLPLHRASRTVLAVRLRLGTIVYQRFSTIMPPERFYLGGAYSLRGYEPDLAPPLNFYRNCKDELIVVPTGGKTMMNGNFELRFTIYQSFGGTLFTDIGILTQNAVTAIRAHDIIGASGFGFRWNTPVGPLRFDIGWKWKKFPGNPGFYDQSRLAWFLTLGNAF